LGEGIVNYFEVKNCSIIFVFETVGGCNRFLMLNLGLIIRQIYTTAFLGFFQKKLLKYKKSDLLSSGLNKIQALLISQRLRF